MSDNQENMQNAAGELGIIPMRGCEDILSKVNNYLLEWRKDEPDCPDTYEIEVDCPRFSSGEAKGHIQKSIRGHDLYILCDVFNYGVTYKMYGKQVPMSPDDHFADLKRIIAAASGKARRITVIMPMLYEGRQHRRISRESLDCALALQELQNMGVTNIITFDAHDPKIQNAIPLIGFDNVYPTYQMIKALVRTVPDIKIDREHLSVISPDEGGMSRCIYYSSVLGLDLGMFYKRRDYSKIVKGRNPIISHEYLGGNIKGMDVCVVDDIIASGDSMIDIAQKLREKQAGRVYLFATFGLFSDGLDRFDEAYKNGLIEKVYTTNLIYTPEELKNREWYEKVDMSKYIAYIIDTLNYDRSMSDLLQPVKRINALLDRIKNK
ncbi:MAG TPA: ribose-phosphate pyrophosphokinase [Clostridia bacterium]|nr:ribose-phosphate pyrophosphokinase [Clostridia bacterium]